MGIESILLVVHLVIALCMVGIVLLQPSDGGGTGLGSDSGNTAISAVRGKGTFLTKTTWALAAAFVIVALVLAWLSRAPEGGGNSDVLNNVLQQSAPAPAVDPFSGLSTDAPTDQPAEAPTEAPASSEEPASEAQ